MKKTIFTSILAASALLFAGCNSEGSTSGGTSEDGTFEPSQNIEMVAPAGAGGGWDTTAREVARVFGETDIIEENMTVVNKEGGGGAIAWAYIHGKDDSPYNLFVASPPLMFVPLNGQSEHGHEDFTPLANMIADYGAFAVSADSEWEDLNDLFDQMKADPESVTVVGTSAPGSMDHMQFVRIAKAAGVDPTKIKYVSDQDGGALTSVLNGSVDVFSTGVGEVVEQVRAGNIKVLGITAEERMEGEVLSDFPTAIEQGIDESFINWRGFFGPPNMDQAAVDYYEAKFKELSESEEFAEVREKYGWNEMYLNSAEYEEFLNTEYEEIEVLLEEIGLGN
ncbi:tripartite tricarboxylate transporter substrate binding protein [Planococcus sp. CPCC 101016]|uniref:tripartite tricarboxylate transporter substrate binding protein n=1 Tax=Planococcus sp. CPCC 101016 TaxID=2599617 RepID=UPI0011B3B8E4|nr:tripartite tricarboxylate transporter substrate-binding protein [Planococcus sp. CPCC 101016]TWT06684.1 tripartite tricarboxylate transporter substrate binding protein [Planococcus sp. CPCC 101016]